MGNRLGFGVGADVILRNARVYTGDPALPWAESVAMKDGKILAVGSDREIEPLETAQTCSVDVGGRMVMPSLIDSHTHAFEGARAELFELQLAPGSTFAQILDAVAAYAEGPDRRHCITGGPWGSVLSAELAKPEALAALDAATADRPVVLRDISVHARFANSRAMKLAGITPETPQPHNGTIGRDPDSGRLTGLFMEAGTSLIDRCVPRWTPEENLAAARRCLEIYHSLGVTGFHLALASRTTLETFHTLESGGELKARIATYLAYAPGLLFQEGDGFGKALIDQRARFAGPHMNVDFVKVFMDGVPGMRTGAFFEPYCCGDGPRCDPYFSVADLAEQIAELDQAGISVRVHAIGDRATRDTLDAIEIVRATNGPGQPHQLSHLNFITAEDIPRLVELDVTADIAPPVWFPSRQTAVMERLLGSERMRRISPIKELIDAGVHVISGTDWPAVSPSPNPWIGLAGLVTRRNPDPNEPGELGIDQAIDLATAIELYTANPAATLGAGSICGRLRAGFSADLILLDRDIFAVPTSDLAATNVLATFFEGELVYDRLGLPPIARS